MPFARRIEPQSATHERRGFSGGEAALDDYLRRFARKRAKARINRRYVAAKGKTVFGYYNLSMEAISRYHLLAHHQRRFPSYPVPVARLAVDGRQQDHGLGSLLLSDALYRCLRLPDEIAAVGVVVDALLEQVQGFYRHYEFEIFPETPLTLWLPMTAIAALFVAPTKASRS